jgi:hypothetical protein
MSLLRGLPRFLYEFVVGDDPLLAAAAVIALALTAAIAGSGAAAWWVTPIVVLAVLALSVSRAADRGARALPRLRDREREGGGTRTHGTP